MAADVNSLIVKVVSDGIDATTKSLNNLTDASTKAEKATGQLSTANKSGGESAKALASALDSALASYRKQSDQLRENVTQSNAYANAMRSVTATQAAITSSVFSLAIAMQALAVSLPQVSANLQVVERAHRSNNEAMQEAHALARGLSGSFGALWVTYGNFAGMAVGLAIGQSLKSIVSVGSDVENTLESIRVRGAATTEEMIAIRDSVYKIGEGVYGPQEVAKAFDALILAGLKAKESTLAIGSAINLATAGGSTIEKAAESLVTIGSAVGATAKDFDYLADGITAAANTSLASVDSISEAVKRASVVNKLYGATFEDILTQTAALAQLGIKNTAAGTAITNFYANAVGSTKKAKDALDELGMSFTDAEGRAKPLIAAYEEFTSKLNKYDLKSQQNFIMNIFGERALRDVEGLRDLVNSAADDTEKYSNRLREVQGQIAEAAGTAALQAAQLGLTTQKQLDSVANTLKTSFSKAFEGMAPQMLVFTSNMKSVFASQEFITGIQNIASGIGSIAQFIAENTTALGYLIEAFVVFKAATLGANLFELVTRGLTGIAVSLGVVQVAANGAAVGVGAVGMALRLLPGVGAVLTAITIGMSLLALHTKETDDNTRKLSDTYNTSFLKSLEDEADRLDKVNKLMTEGRTESDAMSLSLKDQALSRMRLNNANEVATAQKAKDAAQKAYDAKAIQDYTFDKLRSKEATELASATKALTDAQNKASTENQKALDLTQRIISAEQKKKEAYLDSQKAAAEAAKNTAGTLTYSGGKDGKEKAMGLSAIEAELAALRSSGEEQKKILQSEVVAFDNAYKAKQLSVFEYVSAKGKKLKEEQDLTTSTYVKEAEAIAKSSVLAGRNATEKNELSKKLSDLYTKYVDELAKENAAIVENGNVTAKVFQKEAEDSQRAFEKFMAATTGKTAAIQNEIDAYNRLPEAARAAGVTDKQMRDQVTQSAIDNKQKEIDKEIEYQFVGADTIQKLKDEKQALIDLRDVQTTREAQQATNKAAQEYTTAWKQANKQIGNDLAEAIIDGGGKGWKKLIKDMEIGFAKMILQPILAPISGTIASLTTTVGASSPGAVAGTASGAVGLAQIASNVYSAISKGFDGLSTMVSNAAQKTFNALGTSNAQEATFWQNSAAANSIGQAAGYAGGLAAGHMLGNAISGDYSVGGHGQAVVNTSAIIGSIVGGPIGGAIGGAIGGLINRAFGMGSKNVTSQGISGTIAESGVTGQSYQNWQQSGGWFRSDKSGTEKQDLATDVINTFASGLTSLKATSTDFAKNLNVSADALTNYSRDFNITFEGLKEVKGTAAEQAAIIESNTKIQQDAVAKFFNSMGDDMANKLIPNLSDFAKSGETASGTLQRLSETFAATNQIANVLGQDMAKAFGGLGLESAKARQYLVDLAGGISALNTQVTFYATNFLTDAEKIAPVQKAVTAALAEMGYSSVKTTEDFKKLVNGLNLADPAQARMFESLMQLAPAFKQVVDYTASLTDALTGLSEAQQKAIDMAYKQADASFKVLQNSVQAEKDAAKATYDAQVAILNAQISSAEVANKLITDLSNALQSTVDSLKSSAPVTMTSRGAAQQQISDALDTALKTGKLPTADSLKDALSTITKPSDSMYSSYAEYVKDQGITAGKVNQLNDITKGAKTVSDKQLDALKSQLVIAKNTYDSITQGLDNLLTMAQSQLDVLNGISISSASMAKALDSFNSSILTAIATKNEAAATSGGLTAPVEAPKSATAEDIKTLYQVILGREGEASGVDFWLKSGLSSMDVAQGFYTSAEYLASHPNGSHANGLDNVPFDGYTAKLHKGEMVLPAKQAQGVVQGSDISGLSSDINKSNADSLEVLSAMQSDIRKLYKRILDMSPNGQSLQTTAGPA